MKKQAIKERCNHGDYAFLLFFYFIHLTTYVHHAIMYLIKGSVKGDTLWLF